MNSRALYSLGDKLNSLVLSENALFEVFFKVRYFEELCLLYLACGDTRPKLNDLCYVLLCDLNILCGLAEFLLVLACVYELSLYLGKSLVVYLLLLGYALFNALQNGYLLFSLSYCAISGERMQALAQPSSRRSIALSGRKRSVMYLSERTAHTLTR